MTLRQRLERRQRLHQVANNLAEVLIGNVPSRADIRHNTQVFILECRASAPINDKPSRNKTGYFLRVQSLSVAQTCETQNASDAQTLSPGNSTTCCIAQSPSVRHIACCRTTDSDQATIEVSTDPNRSHAPGSAVVDTSAPIRTLARWPPFALVTFRHLWGAETNAATRSRQLFGRGAHCSMSDNSIKAHVCARQCLLCKALCISREVGVGSCHAQDF